MRLPSPSETKGAFLISFKGRSSQPEPIPSPGIDEAPLSIGDSSASGSPLEALHLPDGTTARQMLTERPRPTERPHSSLLYPCGGEPQQTDEGKQLTPSRGKILTAGTYPLPGIDEAPLSIGERIKIY